MTDLILQVCSWFRDHQIGVTLIVLLVGIPSYIIESLRRKGNCKFQFWFMFAVNLIGIMAGVYVFLPTLIGALSPHPVTDQKTFMVAFGSLSIIILTSINIYSEVNALLSKDVQPKRRAKQKDAVGREN